MDEGESQGLKTSRCVSLNLLLGYIRGRKGCHDTRKSTLIDFYSD